MAMDKSGCAVNDNVTAHYELRLLNKNMVCVLLITIRGLYGGYGT